MKTALEIAQLFWEHRGEDNDLKVRMRQVAQSVDGDVIIPLPELNAVDKPAVANLTYVGIQGYAQRFSSVSPNVQFLPDKLTKDARSKARLREQRVKYWWQKDKMPLLDAQAGRYMFGYGTAPMRTDINLVEGRPFISLPSPLGIYVPRPSQVNDLRPDYGIAARELDAKTILARWPNNGDAKRMLKDFPAGRKRWVLEYADAVQTSLVLCGESNERHDLYVSAGGDPVMLNTAPNRAEVSPWVAPGLIHLNKMQGHFDQVMGMYQAQGLLTALELQQAARSVFQETWVVARPNEQPEIVTQADPIRGVVGEIMGGDIRTIAPDAQFHTHMTQDRLAEAQRVTAGVPADFAGQAGSNVRTGRRASQLLSAAVDPSLAEAQTTWALAREEQVKVAAAYERAYLKLSRVFSLKWGGKQQQIEVVPSDLWDKDTECHVSFPVAGTDVNSLAILMGQLQGMNLISTESARRAMPMIDDPEFEKDRIAVEQLESVFMENLGAMIQDPQSPMQLRHLPMLLRKIRDKDVDPIDAFLEIQAEVQKEQATEVEPGPEDMPGLDGAGALPPPIAGPQEGSQNLASLMGALRLPERQVGLSSGGRA